VREFGGGGKITVGKLQGLALDLDPQCRHQIRKRAWLRSHRWIAVR
jgi:hypothetical protein